MSRGRKQRRIAELDSVVAPQWARLFHEGVCQEGFGEARSEHFERLAEELLDQTAQELLSMSGPEFLEKWDTGYFTRPFGRRVRRVAAFVGPVRGGRGL